MGQRAEVSAVYVETPKITTSNGGEGRYRVVSRSVCPRRAIAAHIWKPTLIESISGSPSTAVLSYVSIKIYAFRHHDLAGSVKGRVSADGLL